MKEKYSNNIREIRIAKRISGIEIAKKIGLTKQYYYRIETGERNLSADVAVKISDVLGVSVDTLLRNSLHESFNANEYLKAIELSTFSFSNQNQLMIDGELISTEEGKSVVAYIRTMRQIEQN